MALIKCPECGKEISSTSSVCIQCGYRIKRKTSKHSRRKRARNRAIRRISILASIILLLIIAIWGFVKFASPALFITTDELLASGDYQKAYEKAHDDEEKTIVLAENAAAYACKDVITSLKDPSSFVLREGMYIAEDHIVLEVSGKNGFGGYTTSYWVYEYDETLNTFEYACYLSDLEEEEYYSFDDYEESLEKLLNNIYRALIKDNLSNGRYTFLPEKSIKNINSLFENDLLEDVELIKLPTNHNGTSEMPSSSSEQETIDETSKV